MPPLEKTFRSCVCLGGPADPQQQRVRDGQSEEGRVLLEPSAASPGFPSDAARWR